MSEKKSKTGVWGLCLKFGGKLLSFLPKLVKFTKLIKFGLLAVSFASYAYLFTWKFALLILISIGFHEQCHVFAARHLGMKTKGWYAIPFVGGAAIIAEQYKTYADNVFVAIAGPVGGLLLAIATYAVYLTTGQPMFAAAACWMAMINLFNMAPISPLDAGQIAKGIAMSIHSKLGILYMGLSFAASIFIAFRLHMGLFAFLAFIGLLDLFGVFWNQRTYKRLLEELEEANNEYKAEFGRDLSRYEDKKAEYAAAYKHPDVMNGKQIAITVGASLLTIGALMAIMLLTKHVPGADIATNFMADK